MVPRNTDLTRRVWQRSLSSGPIYSVRRGGFAPYGVGGYRGDRRPQRVQAWSGYWRRATCDAGYSPPSTPLLRTWLNSPKQPLDDLQVDLPDATFDVHTDVDIRFAV